MIYYLYPYRQDKYIPLDYYCIFDKEKALSLNLFGKDYYFYIPF